MESGSKRRMSMAIGLQSLIQNPEVNCNIVMKSLVGTVDKFPDNGGEYYCYLKSCQLCNKNFKPQEDIYMYRGDQGFCSLECRDRQIKLDEMKKLEASTKTLQSSYRQYCGTESRRETQLLLEELRRRNNRVPSFKYRTIFP